MNLNKLSTKEKFVLNIFGFLIGILIGLIFVFNFFFLSKVLPHAGF